MIMISIIRIIKPIMITTCSSTIPQSTKYGSTYSHDKIRIFLNTNISSQNQVSRSLHTVKSLGNPSLYIATYFPFLCFNLHKYLTTKIHICMYGGIFFSERSARGKVLLSQISPAVTRVQVSLSHRSKGQEISVVISERLASRYRQCVYVLSRYQLIL